MNEGKRWINFLLFVLTIISTFFVGYLWGMNYLYASSSGLDIPGLNDLAFLRYPVLIRLSLVYSVSLLVILLSHELGHYLTCRRYGLRATLPYFIPAPTLIGTLGAFIKIKSPLARKKELFDVGANGPIVGFLFSVPVLYFGLQLSKVVPALPRDNSIFFGEPLLLKIFVRLIFGQVGPDQDLILHPLAVAGWVGLLVTSFNLFPVGQLDGGHILYAAFGEKAEKFSLIVLMIMVILGIFFWMGWLLWAVLIYFLGWKHPKMITEMEKMDVRRQLLGFLVVIIFILSFIPAPVSGSSLLELFK
ncbi:MAG: site-2 protease family protein [Candidatus Aminicenantes bacterium]|nr:site-2 protease family protein [Candidatus Aminicenantes bacterium]